MIRLGSVLERVQSRTPSNFTNFFLISPELEILKTIKRIKDTHEVIICHVTRNDFG